MTSKIDRRMRRHARIRTRLSGTAEKPRLVVFRSIQKNYAQLINDEQHVVIAAASDKAFSHEGNKSQRAKKVGELLAKQAQTKGITTCVFDRNGYKYHGRVRALAEGAREGGLKF